MAAITSSAAIRSSARCRIIDSIGKGSGSQFDPSTRGGGIYNEGTLTMTGCTLSGNTASFGGGLYSLEGSGANSLTARNSTISGNTATSGGGGIVNALGRSVLQNCTITANTAPPSGGGGFVSAQYLEDGPERAQIGNTIVSGNTGNDILLSDARLLSLGYNLIGDGAVGDFIGPGDQTGIVNPELNPLALNGSGTTRTHLPLGSSLAFNSGNTDLTVDQNGVARPQNGADDIGAVELVVAAIVVTTEADEDNGSIDPALGSGTSLREAINAANSSALFAHITFSPTVFTTRKTILFWQRAAADDQRLDAHHRPRRGPHPPRPVPNDRDQRRHSGRVGPDDRGSQPRQRPEQ